MKFASVLAALLAAAATAAAAAPAKKPAADPGRIDPAEKARQAPPPSPEQLARTAWFREAKFGMFIHWGLYAIPAGEWKGSSVKGIGEWIMNRGKIPVEEYAALAKQFNPVKFDADAWVAIAKDAGMRYMAITSKHHDGFALFGTRASPYNVVDATPFKRDVLKDLSGACARQGLRLGFYYSQSQDWHHPGGAAAGGHWDKAQDGDFDAYLRGIAEPQVRELLTGYGPVALIWFDTPLEMTEERAGRFVRLVRELQPACLINGRLRADREGFDYASMRDNQIPTAAVPGAWETPATLNDTWGYRKDDHNWKSPGEIVYKLVDIVSKGGNYLLNVGPTAEGVIPEESVKILREVGAWMKVNGEAIYGSGPTPFGAEFGSAVDARDEYGRAVKISSGRAWRCTTRPGRLYFHLLQWPAEEFAVDGVAGRAAKAYLLADPARASLAVRQDGARLSVALPKDNPGRHATVLCVELAPPR